MYDVAKIKNKCFFFEVLLANWFEIFKRNLLFIQFKAYGNKLWIKKIKKINTGGSKYKRKRKKFLQATFWNVFYDTFDMINYFY